MKSTGIVRPVDPLGRVVIPVEIRRNMNIKPEDPIEVFVDGDFIMLRKYEPSCIFCGEAENVINIKGKNICRNCLDEMKSL
jgi:AbrB family transcriptional regulator, transcriptional pleiotropic regulator of transition state genes